MVAESAESLVAALGCCATATKRNKLWPLSGPWARGYPAVGVKAAGPRVMAHPQRQPVHQLLWGRSSGFDRFCGRMPARVGRVQGGQRGCSSNGRKSQGRGVEVTRGMLAEDGERSSNVRERERGERQEVGERTEQRGGEDLAGKESRREGNMQAGRALSTAGLCWSKGPKPPVGAGRPGLITRAAQIGKERRGEERRGEERRGEEGWGARM